jgi:hypothetical protein
MRALTPKACIYSCIKVLITDMEKVKFRFYYMEIIITADSSWLPSSPSWGLRRSDGRSWSWAFCRITSSISQKMPLYYSTSTPKYLYILLVLDHPTKIRKMLNHAPLEDFNVNVKWLKFEQHVIPKPPICYINAHRSLQKLLITYVQGISFYVCGKCAARDPFLTSPLGANFDPPGAK